MNSKHLFATITMLSFLIVSCHKDFDNQNSLEVRSFEIPEVKPNILPYLPNSIKL